MPGGGNGDDGVDVFRSEPGLVERLQRRLFDQRQRRRKIGLVAIDPAARLEIPVDRHGAMPLFDAGILEDRHQPLALGAEKARSLSANIDLPEDIRWNGGGKT